MPVGATRNDILIRGKPQAEILVSEIPRVEAGATQSKSHQSQKPSISKAIRHKKGDRGRLLQTMTKSVSVAFHNQRRIGAAETEAVGHNAV